MYTHIYDHVYFLTPFLWGDILWCTVMCLTNLDVPRVKILRNLVRDEMWPQAVPFTKIIKTPFSTFFLVRVTIFGEKYTFWSLLWKTSVASTQIKRRSISLSSAPHPSIPFVHLSLPNKPHYMIRYLEVTSKVHANLHRSEENIKICSIQTQFLHPVISFLLRLISRIAPLLFHRKYKFG
jgi:hypothetical protein